MKKIFILLSNIVILTSCQPKQQEVKQVATIDSPCKSMPPPS